MGLEDRLERMIDEAVALFPGTIAAISELIAASWSIIFVACLGVVLTLFRNWFMANATTLAHESQAITAAINLAVDYLNVIGLSVQVVIDAVVELVSLFGRSSAIKPFTPQTIPFLNSTTFARACVDLPRQCASVDTPKRLFQLAITPVASSATCGFFRYIVGRRRCSSSSCFPPPRLTLSPQYPVQWVFELLYPPAEALALTYPPYPPGTGPAEYRGQNCTCPDSYGCSYQWECILLGSGIWLLEFVLPLVILGAIWNGLASKVVSLVIAAVEEVLGITWIAGVRTVQTVDKAVEFIAEETAEEAVSFVEKID